MNYIRCIAFIIAIIPSIAASVPPVTEVIFEILDADTYNPVVSNILVDGGVASDGKYTLRNDAESRIAIEIRVDAGGQYQPRILKIFLEGLKNSRAIYKIFLAKRESNTIYTRGHVNKASEYINNTSVDRAVVMLERINAEITPTTKETQFGVFLSYNLARAYFLNCTARFVDQCQDAKSIFNDLHSSYDNKNRFFAAESISKEQLNKDSVVEAYSKRMDYLRAKWDISCGRFEDALKTYEELLADARSNPSLLQNLRINLEGLQNDIRFVTEKLKR